MSLVEYLYVDHRRLDSYVEQFMSLQTFDKVPVWKTGIGLTGPRVEGTQQQQVRPLTTHEKVMALNQYLRKGKHVSDSRWDGQAEKPPTFVSEECKATKIFIPAKETSIGHFTGLTLWLSERPEISEIRNKADLVLIQDLLQADSEAKISSHSIEYGWSGFTWLMFLEEQAKEEFSNSILFCRSNEVQAARMIDPWPSFSSERFLTALQRIGCIVGCQRSIRTLYRTRYVLNTYHTDASSYVSSDVCGYPIYITEAEDSALVV